MAIETVYYRPHIWTPAWNPIIWSFKSGAVQLAKPQFSYVIDLYINGATGYSHRIKQKPNPQGVCMVDVSTIMQGYIGLDDWTAEKGWPLQYRNADDTVATVILRVGEEYLFGGVLTIFDGAEGQEQGPPAYVLGSREETGNPVRVLPAALNEQDGMYHLSTTTAYGYFAPYLMDGNGRFLTQGPTGGIDLRYGDHHTLTFLNWNDGATGSWQSPVQGMRVRSYGAAGNLVATYNFPNTTGNGGGPQTSEAYTTATETRVNYLEAFRCGPVDLGLPTFGQFKSYSYDVTPYYKSTNSAATTFQTVAGETVRFVIDIDECESNLYQTVRLSWLNELGGRDYYNFKMFYEKTVDAEEQVYYQPYIQWDSTTPVALSTSTNTTLNWLAGGDKIFNKYIKTSIAIESDWLTQEYVDFLGGIPQSPSVWCYIGDNPIPYTARVTNLSYSYKNIKQEKLVNVLFELELTKVQIRQNN